MRTLKLALVGAALGAAIPAGVAAGDPDRTHRRDDCPIVIAHRGASGYRPEHTLEAYELAIEQGADFVEPDLVSTRDGVLIARHDNVLNLTTDVASRPAFASRRTTKTVDGVVVADSWFSEDFTLAEIKTLRAIERIPAVRPENTEHDGLYEVPTLQEVIDLVQREECRRGRRIGLYPETKHPTYFDGLGLSLEEPLVRTLHRNGYRKKSDPVFIQSFEVANLKDLARMTKLRLVQLLWLAGKPWDVEAAGGSLTYDEMATPSGLAEIARYADGVGPEKYHFLIPLDDEGRLDVAAATTFVADAHRKGLLVHPYTFRAENAFLPADFDSSADPLEHGDLEGEIQAFLALGIDGFFVDQPDLGVDARDDFVGCGCRRDRRRR
jgi:glycerophosphoryl diester phosphodiesterase